MVAIAVCLVGLGVALLNDNPERGTILFLGGAAWTALGAYHRTRYSNPLGAWAVIGGAAWLIARIDEADHRWLFTVGNVISMIDVPPFFLILMTFPLGRLSVSAAAVDPATGLVDPGRVRGLRRLLWAITVWSALSSVWVLFSDNPNPGCTSCDARNHYIHGYEHLVTPLQLLQGVTLAILGFFVLRASERSFRTRDPLHRAAHIPARIGIWAIFVSFTAFLLAGDEADLAEPASRLTKVTFMLLPLLYGFALYRWNELEEDARRALRTSTAAGPEAVQAALREHLRDPDLRLTPATGDENGEHTGRRTVLRDREGRPAWVAEHRIRTPESTLLDDALQWAAGRLIPDGGNGDDEAAWGPRVATLTDAELTTALLIARQHKNAEIAGELHLSLGTINNRVSRIYQKLGLAESSRRERASTMTRLQSVLIAEQRRRGE